MAEIVETYICQLTIAAVLVEMKRLGAGHVGAQPGEKDDAGWPARHPVIGDRLAIGALQRFGRGHRGLAAGREDGDDSIMRSPLEDRPEEECTPEGRPPAVLQIVPSLVSGGAERGTVELAAALTTAGWNAYVASSGGPLEHDVARVGATHLTLPLASKNPLIMRRNRTALVREIRRLDIDIVHARSRAPAWSAWSAAEVTGRHFVTTFHNAYGAGSRLKRRYNSVLPRGVDLDLFDTGRVGGERIASLARQWRLPDGV